MTTITEVHAYGLGELLFLGMFFAFALVSAFTTWLLVPDRRTVTEKRAEQAAIDAAPVASSVARREPVYEKAA
jgi:hypothetical protein